MGDAPDDAVGQQVGQDAVDGRLRLTQDACQLRRVDEGQPGKGVEQLSVGDCHVPSVPREGRGGQLSFGSAGVRVCHTTSIGEDVGEAQPFGQIEQGHHVLRVGTAPALLPAPYGVAVCANASGDLRLGQAGLPLEPLEALREAVGEVIGLHVVVNPLSRHGAALPKNSAATALSERDSKRKPKRNVFE